MLVRIGKKRGAYVYAAASALSWAGMFLAVEAGIPGKCMYFYIPVMILSLIITASVLRGKYKSYDTLEPLCGLNILVNIGTTASIIFAFI
jgi:1,4-dihydroxy-2-naphthoate octaprenyltransferase